MWIPMTFGRWDSTIPTTFITWADAVCNAQLELEIVKWLYITGVFVVHIGSEITFQYLALVVPWLSASVLLELTNVIVLHRNVISLKWLNSVGLTVRRHLLLVSSSPLKYATVVCFVLVHVTGGTAQSCDVHIYLPGLDQAWRVTVLIITWKGGQEQLASVLVCPPRDVVRD